MYRGGVNEDPHHSNQDEARIFRVWGPLEFAAAASSPSRSGGEVPWRAISVQRML
jgi:hypothetical protein